MENEELKKLDKAIQYLAMRAQGTEARVQSLGAILMEKGVVSEEELQRGYEKVMKKVERELKSIPVK